MTSLTAPGVVDALAARVVGRRRELEVLAAALAADRHVLLEGPPGTGKSTMLREVAAAAGTGFVFVEGNAELTPARLAGQFDPSRVLEDGYVPDVFVDGPLVEALRNGSLLDVEELNRVPEETVNLLITVMSEGELTLPRLGTIAASEGFRLVAAMNPFDNIGTARVSGAVYDRMCRIAMGYQSLDNESDIVVRNTSADDRVLRRRAVAVTRATRTHPDVRVGSSVRGAIDLVEVGHAYFVSAGSRIGAERKHLPPFTWLDLAEQEVAELVDRADLLGSWPPQCQFRARGGSRHRDLAGRCGCSEVGWNCRWFTRTGSCIAGVGVGAGVGGFVGDGAGVGVLVNGRRSVVGVIATGRSEERQAQGRDHRWTDRGLQSEARAEHGRTLRRGVESGEFGCKGRARGCGRP